MEADRFATLQDGQTVFHCGAQFYEGFLPLLFLIKEFNMDLNVGDSSNGTALHFAITEGEFKNVELLIRHGADVNL